MSYDLIGGDDEDHERSRKERFFGGVDNLYGGPHGDGIGSNHSGHQHHAGGNLHSAQCSHNQRIVQSPGGIANMYNGGGSYHTPYGSVYGTPQGIYAPASSIHPFAPAPQGYGAVSTGHTTGSYAPKVIYENFEEGGEGSGDYEMIEEGMSSSSAPPPPSNSKNSSSCSSSFTNVTNVLLFFFIFMILFFVAILWSKFGLSLLQEYVYKGRPLRTWNFGILAFITTLFFLLIIWLTGVPACMKKC